MVGRSLLLLTTNYRSKSAAFIGQISTMQQNSLQFFPWDDMCGAQCTGRNAGSLRHPWGTLHPNRMTFACALADHDPGRKILDLTVVIFAYLPWSGSPRHHQDDDTQFLGSVLPTTKPSCMPRFGNPGAWPRHTKTRGTLEHSELVSKRQMEFMSLGWLGRCVLF